MLRCPSCNNPDCHVIESRLNTKKNCRSRRYKCDRCDTRFSTREEIAPLSVKPAKSMSVINLTTGNTYASQKEAANQCHVKPSAIARSIKDGTPAVGNQWAWADSGLIKIGACS